MKITEVTALKPPTPEQQRIKAMQAQVKRAQEAVKAERARQRMQKAQQSLTKTMAVSNSTV
jgi:membrane protein insertase Oxa1/YidC/SpoIIIJ